MQLLQASENDLPPFDDNLAVKIAWYCEDVNAF